MTKGMSAEMPVCLCGLGTARPAGTFDQNEAVHMAHQRCCHTERQRRILGRIYHHSTVSSRGSVLVEEPGRTLQHFYQPAGNGAGRGPRVSERMQAYAEHALPLAQQAAERALADSRWGPEEIVQLVSVSCTGFAAPGVEVSLVEALGLPPTVGRTHLGFMGCHGAINGLRVASALAQAQPGQGVLMCAVELCSLHFQYGWDAQRVTANALFADGAAALVLAAGRETGDPGEVGPPIRVAATGSRLLPDSRQAMRWEIGDHGFEMSLSPRVPDLIGAHLLPWLQPWLAEQGVEMEEVGGWAVHPGGPRVIEAVEQALSLPAGTCDISREVLRRFGNMSSPTVLFITEAMRELEVPRPWVWLGFGPGLVVEAALVV